MSPWVRIDENAMDHPKIGGLPDGAFRLWVQGLAYCQKYLTDGFIGDVALRGLRAYSQNRRNVLIECGLWDSSDKGINVHDYLEWNESRETIVAARNDARARRQRWKDKHKDASHSVDETRQETRPVLSGVKCGDVGTSVKKESFNRVGSVMAGALPKNHLAHAWCGRVCVPEFLHNQFVQATGKSDDELYAFYRHTFDGIPLDEPVEPDAMKFWRPRVSAKWPPKQAQSGPTAEDVVALMREKAARS